MKKKSPLWKRLLREFISEFGKYLVIFLFLAGTIGFVSGFLVAGGSMIQAYNNSFFKYNIEDGHFVLEQEAEEELLFVLKEDGIEVEAQYYMEQEADTDADGKTESTLRIYKQRNQINQVCLMEGAFPETDTEIAVDRMYADNNGVIKGDTLLCGGKELTVSGLVALSDYSALFSDNSDMMFDAVKFGVAVMMPEGFETFLGNNLYYNYCWKYDKTPKSDAAKKQAAEDLMEIIAEHAVLQAFVPEYSNQAVHFTGDDMGGERTMMIALLYILIMILAFVFSVTINHTIVKEASVIGTLRALGYTKKELLEHYLAIPVIVTLFVELAGNVLGYTVFKNIVVSMYYNSYSLPTYETIWNGEAFLLTTVVPVILMLLINLLMLLRRLSLSPLQFLRSDFGKKGQKKALRLPHIRFFKRFRIRIILQNASGFVTLLIGIVFANILLLFGMMMTPLLSHYQDEIVDSMPAKYQYILKAPAETKEPSAEKYCAASLAICTEPDADRGESITVYGIVPESRYWNIKMPNTDDGALISDGYAEKYGMQTGDAITLKEAYGETLYTFTVAGTINNPAVLSVFLSQEAFNRTLGYESDAYQGYFSEEELTDIDGLYIASCITEEDLTKVSRQLTVSMGKMFYLVNIFAVLLSVLLIYLLTKLNLEKNTKSISLVKILGYKNHEIAQLYLTAITWVVSISILISLVVSTWFIRWVFVWIMKNFSGWLPCYIEPSVYGKMFIIGIAVYFIVAFCQFERIRRIPMDEALKNVE